MNLEETHKLLTIMRAGYQNFHKNSDFDEELLMIQRGMWQNAFSDCSYEEVFTAFNIWLATEPFPPTLFAINKL